MSELKPTGFGAVLRRRREELALSLDDLAASTRIRKTYLQALEEENLQALPGSTYTLGFLRIYARQLSLPVEPLLAAMNDAELGDDDAAAAPAGKARRHRVQRTRRDKGGSRRLQLLLLLLAGVAAVYLALRLYQPPRPPLPPPVLPAAPSAPQPAPPPPVAVTPVQPAPVTPAPPAAKPEGETAGVDMTELAVIPAQGAVVRMLPIGTGMMKVSLDGQESRDYELLPEQSLHWKVSDSLAVELSTPGLVRIWVDQQELQVADHASLILTRARGQEPRP